MRRGKWMASRRWSGVVAGAVVLSGSVALQAQQSKATAIPDAQVESNVLKALGEDATLKGQPISSTSVYGVVTLSGRVPDESTRVRAEGVVSRTMGVTKVVDELTLGVPTAATTGNPVSSGAQAAPVPQDSGTQANEGSNPMLQSDGTVAQSGDQSGAPQQQAGVGEEPGQNTAPPAYPSPQQGSSAGDTMPAYGQAQAAQGYPAQGPYGAPGQYGPPQQPYGGQGSYGASGPNGPQGSYPAASPYGAPGQGQYAQGYAPAVPQGPQQPAGVHVTVPAGATLILRVNSGIDNKHTPVGTAFSGTVVQDVVDNGYVAVPRGATVQGTVVDATSAGVLRGRAELGLQLTGLTLGGTVYPLNSNIWSRSGGDKTSRTVGSAIGLGALGALVGGAAGGGAGAAIGAGAGAGLGIGSSAASSGGEIVVPPESVLTFHLQAPLDMVTVSQAEMNRLAYNVPANAYGPPRLVRRYPVYGPYGPYGPGVYAYPRYYRAYPY